MWARSRLPDAKRLAWAAKVMPDRSVRPRNQPEVYRVEEPGAILDPPLGKHAADVLT